MSRSGAFHFLVLILVTPILFAVSEASAYEPSIVRNGAVIMPWHPGNRSKTIPCTTVRACNRMDALHRDGYVFTIVVATAASTSENFIVRVTKREADRVRLIGEVSLPVQNSIGLSTTVVNKFEKTVRGLNPKSAKITIPRGNGKAARFVLRKNDMLLRMLRIQDDLLLGGAQYLEERTINGQSYIVGSHYFNGRLESLGLRYDNTPGRTEETYILANDLLDPERSAAGVRFTTISRIEGSIAGVLIQDLYSDGRREYFVPDIIPAHASYAVGQGLTVNELNNLLRNLFAQQQQQLAFYSDLLRIQHQTALSIINNF